MTLTKQGKTDKRTVKRSPNAKAVAEEVKRRMLTGERINLKEIAVSKGYSVASANSQKPYRTKTFKEAIAPVTERMKHIHDKALAEIAVRDFSTERLDSVVNVARQMVHDTRLLEDKSTENVGVQVVVYGAGDVLGKHLTHGGIHDEVVSKEIASP